MNQLVVDDGRNRWYFTVWAEEVSDDGSQPNTLRYGATDEAGKINLNTAERRRPPGPAEHDERTGGLPHRLPRPAQRGPARGRRAGLLRPTGPSPYQIANAPLTTLDELLLVKGFTARIVYGEDANLNGLLDPNEDDGDASFPPDNGDGVLDRGLRAWPRWSRPSRTSTPAATPAST